MEIQSIKLENFLDHFLGIQRNFSDEDFARIHEAVNPVKKSRKLELFLGKKLHPWLVRRLDAGFARSSTVHPDTGLALYKLCYLTSAQNIFETGTYWGFSTAYLAAGIKDKGVGQVYSFDIYRKAGKHIPKALSSYVTLYRGKPSIDSMPEVLDEVSPDLFFQDSRHDYEGVRQELEVVAPYLKENSIVLFHDFICSGVREAAHDVLKDFQIYILETSDPQQLGVAINKPT